MMRVNFGLNQRNTTIIVIYSVGCFGFDDDNKNSEKREGYPRKTI